VSGVDFQACSFNHSDISPFRINELRAVWNSVAQNPPSRPITYGDFLSDVTSERVIRIGRSSVSSGGVRPAAQSRSYGGRRSLGDWRRTREHGPRACQHRSRSHSSWWPC